MNMQNGHFVYILYILYILFCNGMPATIIYNVIDIQSSLHCPDIDECGMKDDCHQNAECLNFEGGYNCTCLEGFTGNGTYCEGTCMCNIYRYVYSNTYLYMHNNYYKAYDLMPTCM